MKRFPLLFAVCLGALVVARPAHGQGRTFLGKSLEGWRKDLRDPQAKVRRSAAFALGRFGLSARHSVPDLRRLLREDSSAEVRDMAAVAIGDIAKAAGDGDPRLWGSVSSGLTDALRNDKEPHVRRSAAYALAHLRAGCRDGELPACGTARPGRLGSSERRLGLGQIGEEAQGAVEELCGCLSDRDVLVRRDAAIALGSMGKSGSPAVARLIDMVKREPDEVVKKAALDSLYELVTPENKALARGLDPLLQDKDSETTLKAALVLARVGGEESFGAMPVLQKA